MTLEVQHLTDVEVPVPDRAASFAAKAQSVGWTVTVTTTRGPAKTPAGEDVHVVRLEVGSDEDGGKRRQVKGDVKIIDVVAVRCRREDPRDLVVAVWEDGSFDSACRPWALKMLSSAEATKHITQRSTAA